VDAAGNLRVRPGGDRELDLSHNIELLNVPAAGITRAQGDIHVFGNPHYWISPANALIMANAIRVKLEEVDPGSGDYYRARHEQFAARLEGKIREWTERVKPIKGARVVAYHDEWPYFAQFVGVQVVDFVEPKPGIPPTPRHIEQLAEMMRESGVRLIIQSTFFPDSSSSELAERTGARVEKLCQGVGELPECADFVSMIDFNVGRLVSGLDDVRQPL
jgi:ABC-type Zn uptake system ZnuABC Zn-binding protein ZnuA